MKAREITEKGVVLPFLAVSIVALLMVVGLAVDLNLLFNSITGLKNRADLVATSALRAYWDEEANGVATEAEAHRLRLAAALTEAKRVAAHSENLPFYKILMGSSDSKHNNLCLWGDDGCSDPSGASLNGWLIPGSWFSFEPTGGCAAWSEGGTCPCNAAGVFAGPCFRPLDADDFRASAFQVELQTTEDEPMPSLFARFAGQAFFRPTAIGTASLKPRRLIFAFDFSGSMDDSTHPQNLGESTYKLVSPTCPDDPLEHLNWNTLELAETHIVGTYDLDYSPEPFGWSFATMPAQRPSGVPGDDPPIARYKSDYRCFQVPNDPVGPAAYLIDTYPRVGDDPDPGYTGPQPLTRSLDGLSYALNRFSERGVPGDLVGLILFDRYIAPERYFGPVPPDRSNAVFQDMLAIADRSHPDHFQKRLDHLALVRVDPVSRECAADDWEHECKTRGIFSNLQWAIRESERLLTQFSDWPDADNQVLLFSDMLSNCRGDPYDDEGEWRGLENLWCIDDSGMIEWSELNTIDMMRDHIVPKRIVINPFPAGSANLSPHTEIVPNGKAGALCDCLTEEESRLQNIGLGTGSNTVYKRNSDGKVFTNIFDNYWDYTFQNYATFYCKPACEIGGWDLLKDTDPNTTYARPQNWLGILAKPTGGVWGLVRPPCTADPNNPDAPAADITDKLRAMCRAGMPGGACRPPNTWHEMNPWDTGIRGASGLKGWTDQYGRLFCDPKGRSTDQQMRDYMDQILGQSPYSLNAPLRSVVP